MGMVCTQNDAGNYCFDEFDKMGMFNDEDDSSATPAPTTSCGAPAAVADLGCCTGVITMIMAMSNETTAEDYQHMTACGIDVSTPPCSSSVDTALVATTIALSGGTVETFCCSACQTAVID